STVTNFLRLLGLPKEIKQGLANNSISMGHAKALLSLDRVRDQLQAASAIVKKGLSVREAEALASQLKSPPKQTKARTRLSSDLKAVEEKLKKALGTKVSISAKSKGGKIMIDYYSNDDLDRILDKIC
ncbi:MAG TPA: chromosome partitioning protein, partial [Nitrospiraceae bacterium]|nr:chromosome partitioning protein [Nitrospiraceae bacterium]